MSDQQSERGPRRTREHVIASQSQNYVEKFFIDQGHALDRPTNDYGIDLAVLTFDRAGYAEGGNIQLQLKATDTPHFSRDRSYIAVKIETKHYHFWMKQLMPVFLIVYDAQHKQAYWLYVQAYFNSPGITRPRSAAATKVVRIPSANLFTEFTVEYMRKKKTAILEMDANHEH